MYWGSVRFFRHAILGLAVCVVLALLVSTGMLLDKTHDLRIENEGLLASQRALAQELESLQADMQQPEAFVAEVVQPLAAQMDIASLDYQLLYPTLTAQPPEQNPRPSNTVYLTFDDGPTQYTDEILRILDKYDVKATFFVVGKDTPEGRARLQRIAAAGHTIGIHSYSHKYGEIYRSVEDYLEDFNQAYEWVYKTTGIKPSIFRFPGGSINAYSRGNYQQIIAEMLRRGFTYYDWNISAEDTVKNPTASSVKRNVLDNLSSFSSGIILLHDGPRCTVSALDDVIAGILEKGYALEPLTAAVQPVTFTYSD